MSSRIASLKVRHFRGVPGSLTVSLRAADGRPASLLLVGDNGTGKSSIADAIEFGLQARIGRQKSLSSPLVGSPVSFSSDATPVVEIELSTGEVVRREVALEQGIPIMPDGRSHPDFSFAAFVLRRADILRFLETAEDDRQLMFVDYIGGRRGGEWAGSMEEENFLREDKRQRLKEEIGSELTALSAMYGWPAPPVVLAEPELDGLLKRRLYRGVSVTEAKKRGIRIRTKPGTDERIDHIRALIREYKTVSRRSGRARRGPDFKKAMETLHRVLHDASDILTESFKTISPANFVDRFEIAQAPGKEFSLRVDVMLKNGRSGAPKQIFSEANQDLLALLMFLALVEEATRNGQSPCLVIDDVFQSVDATVRVAVMEYVITRFRNWQLVITAHDRLWFSQVRSILQRHGHPFVEREILRWTFEGGPVLSGAGTEDVEVLKEAIERGDVTTICALAGILHEAIADRLSWTLPISITRRPSDRYTLGDLWPPIVKALRKTTVAPVVDSVDRWVHLRNLAGAHYNEWARSLSVGEARAYGHAVLDLANSVRCTACGRWIERIGSAPKWECRCGQTRLAPPKPEGGSSFGSLPKASPSSRTAGAELI